MKKTLTKPFVNEDSILVLLYVGEGCNVGDDCGNSGENCFVGGDCGVGTNC